MTNLTVDWYPPREVVSRARLSRGERVWSNPHHHLSVLIELVMNGGGWLPFLACCLESEAEDLPLERIPIYVHTYFTRCPAAEYAITSQMGI